MVTSGENYVYVGREPVEGSLEALPEPNFLIEMDGKYYMALAVWEYDIEAARMAKDEAQVEGCKRIAEAFRDSKAKFECTPSPPRLLALGGQTAPKPKFGG